MKDKTDITIEVLKYYDNPMFNAEAVGESFSTANQFSIIVKKG